MVTKKNAYWKELLLLIFNQGGFKFIDPSKRKYWFAYAFGLVGPHFFQAMNVFGKSKDKVFIPNKKGFEIMKKAFAGYDLSEFDLITCGERRDWPFGTILSWIWEIPCAHITKTGAWIGDEQMNLGSFQRILHVGDLNNNGKSLREWNQYVQNAGALGIDEALFLFDRDEGGKKVAEELGIQLHTMVDLDGESWAFLRNNDLISQEIYEEVKGYWEDRYAWGLKKLLAYPEDLNITPPDKKEKIFKIFEEYFPGFTEEINKKLQTN